jgi:hypothetical protein
LPVEVVQLQPVHPLDPVIGHPFLAAAIGTRPEPPVQDAGEDGALDGKLKTAAGEQLAQYLGNAEPSDCRRELGITGDTQFCPAPRGARRVAPQCSISW